jgi:hypothetical protein
MSVAYLQKKEWGFPLVGSARSRGFLLLMSKLREKTAAFGYYHAFRVIASFFCIFRFCLFMLLQFRRHSVCVFFRFLRVGMDAGASEFMYRLACEALGRTYER